MLYRSDVDVVDRITLIRCFGDKQNDYCGSYSKQISLYFGKIAVEESSYAMPAKIALCLNIQGIPRFLATTPESNGHMTLKAPNGNKNAPIRAPLSCTKYKSAMRPNPAPSYFRLSVTTFLSHNGALTKETPTPCRILAPRVLE